MTIVGLGTHILECSRVQKLILKHADVFLQQVFTAREVAYCSHRSHSTEFYAAFWASKEAVFRALGTKWKRGLSWRDIEVLCTKAIAPTVEVTGSTGERLRSLGVKRIHLTFSYSRYFATATAIASAG